MDFGIATAPDTVRIERLLPGPIERIWDYLTDPELRSCWLADGPMALREGGTVELLFRNSSLAPDDDPAPAKYAQVEHEARLSGTILACEPPHLLAYTWGDDEHASEVRFDLVPAGDEVRLTVTHRRLATREDAISVASGWHTHLGILLDRLHGRTPAGFWTTHTRLEAAYRERLPTDRAH